MKSVDKSVNLTLAIVCSALLLVDLYVKSYGWALIQFVFVVLHLATYHIKKKRDQ